MNEWAVERNRQRNGEYYNGWKVWNGIDEHGWFPTWRQAQDYADKQARTVEVVLPREANHAGWYAISSNELYVNFADGFTSGTLPIEIAKEFALTLLAHHYKQAQTNGNH